jgi:AcrR family transcriptional regulator
MDATVRLLREGGVAAATPAAVVARAGSGKYSLYRLFDSKDNLLAEALREFAPRQSEILLGDAARNDGLGPRERILGIFDRMARAADSGDLAPCIYLTSRLELADPTHPVAVVARDFKDGIVDALTADLTAMGHPTPEATAQVISLMIDGAIIHAVITGSPAPATHARAAVQILLDHPLVTHG